MAKRKVEDQSKELVVVKQELSSLRKAFNTRRSVRHKKLHSIQKADGDSSEHYERNIQEDEDRFESLYVKNRLIQPPYPFHRLTTVYEESDLLQGCIDAKIQNIDGFGYKLVFLGDDQDKDSPQAKQERVRLENFLDYANEEESWRTIRKKFRQDMEALGNGAFEMLRSRAGRIQLAYHAPFKDLRMSKQQTKPVTVTLPLQRDGKVINIKVKKYFRKYAQLGFTGKRLRWFKEFGDPRPMDATNGEYKSSNRSCKKVASEIWHFKYHFGSEVYGLPKWIGAILQVMGKRYATFVNYDLFNNQGIPPLVVLVNNGTLSDESWEDLEAIIRGMRGVTNWNRVAVLESEAESAGLEDKGNAKIELKNLAEFRKDDLMFDKYMDRTTQDLRHSSRIPPLYFGDAKMFTHATAKASQTVGEEQVFIPNRQDFDEPWNAKITRNELGVTLWRMESKGPKVAGSNEISNAVEVFTKAGAISINNAIERGNEALGLEMSRIDAEWANFPLTLILELVKMGKTLKGMELLVEAEDRTIEDNVKQLDGKEQPSQLYLPGPAKKFFKSDMFSNKEKQLYRMLLGLQTIAEDLTER